MSPVDSSAEPDDGSGSDAGAPAPTEPSGAAASVPAEDAVVLEDVDADDEDADDDDDVDDDDVDEDSPDDVDALPAGSAYEIPGVDAMATPTPSVTANAPTRPMHLA